MAPEGVILCNIAQYHEIYRKYDIKPQPIITTSRKDLITLLTADIITNSFGYVQIMSRTPPGDIEHEI